MRVLAVDDREEDLYLLNKMLEEKGFEVVSATNGREALEKIREAPPDLIISDILMPEVDGYQLLKKVRSSRELSKIPFVFYTATYTSKEDEEFAYSLGASRFIVKPEEPERFMKLITKTLEDHRAGVLMPVKPSIESESLYLREYNERLVQKLEDKVSELRQAKEEVERSRDLVQALVNSIRDGIIFLDLKWEVVLANETGRRLQKEVLKKVVPRLKEAKEDYCDFDLPFEDRYYDIACYPVSTGEGRVLGTTVVLRDVTDRKMVQDELSMRLEELEKWQRLTVGREMKMLELKRRIRELEDKIGRLERGA